jgi:hypothetical protein
MTARTPSSVDSPWLIGTREIGAYLRMSPDEVGDLLRTGDLRGNQKKRGGTWRTHKQWADAFLAGETPQPITGRRTA